MNFVIPYKASRQKRFSTFDYIHSGFGRRDIGALLHLNDWIKTRVASWNSVAQIRRISILIPFAFGNNIPI